MDHDIDPYRINIQSRDRDMANCGDEEAFATIIGLWRGWRSRD
jgi:hypothetical protein